MAECFDWGYRLFRLSNDQGWLTICTCALWIHELSGAFGSRSCMLVTFSNHLLCHCDASAEIGKIRIELNPILLQVNYSPPTPNGLEVGASCFGDPGYSHTINGSFPRVSTGV